MLGFAPISSVPISALPIDVGTRPVQRRRASRDPHPSSLAGKITRSPNYHTGEAFYYSLRKGTFKRQPYYPVSWRYGRVRRQRVPGTGESAFTVYKRKTRRWRPVPKQWQQGKIHRQRVPGTGLSSLPVIPPHRVVQQIWFPVSWLEGRVWRTFPQQFKELIAPAESPERRRDADESRTFGLRDAPESWTQASRADESRSFEAKPDEAR